MLSELIDRLPETWRVGFASRSRPRLPLARLRAAGELLEIHEGQLALNAGELAQVLAGFAVVLPDDARAALHAQTEGWPVGVSLAAMAIRDRATTWSGDDRYLREYLRSEVLAGVTAREMTLLVRCSLLDELSGPLCDAVLGVRSSGAVLEHLDVLRVVRPVRRDGDRYECPPLLRDLLRAELHRKEPTAVATVHRSAARWYAANALPESAIEHAHLSGDVALLSRLVLEHAQATWAGGHIETVHQWMSWLEEAKGAPSFPAIAAHAALIFALVGDPARADRWSAMATTANGTEMLSDGSTVEGVRAYLRAIEARRGVDEMLVDAQLAWAGLSPASPYRVTMLHTEGLAALLAGDLELADDLFLRTVEAGEAASIHPLVAMVLCERATIAVARGDWNSAIASVRRATTIVTEHHYGAYWTSALVHAWAARTALHRGLRTEATKHLAAALALRPLLTHALPVVSTQALLTTAHASLSLGDVQAAAATVQQANEIMRRRPRLGDLPVQVALMSALVQEHSSRGHSAKLTAAEVRLMPYLATQLTFPMIGERLGISGNTVKTQAISSYRKLGVSSRIEAVAIWQELAGDDDYRALVSLPPPPRRHPLTSLTPEGGAPRDLEAVVDRESTDSTD